MTYTKPELIVLGYATNVIELNGVPKQVGPVEGIGAGHIAPAYDLDE